MDILTSHWVIIILIMAALIGNVVAFKYLTPKNLNAYKKKDQNLERLIELDKKRQKNAVNKKEDKEH